MRTQLAKISLAATAVAALAVFTGPAALAAGTWTVTGGTSLSGAPASGTTFTFTDTANSQSLACTGGAIAGTVTDESGSANAAVSALTSLRFTSCTGPLGLSGSVAQATGTAATLNATSYNSGSKLTTGTITSLNLNMTLSGALGTCAATIKGTAGITYSDTTLLLRFTTAGDSLKVTSTSGSCAGFVATGNPITLSSGTGGFILTGSPTNPIVIKQP